MSHTCPAARTVEGSQVRGRLYLGRVALMRKEGEGPGFGYSDCRGGPRVLIFLFQTSAGLRAGANIGGLERRGSLLLKVQHIGSDLG